MREFWVSSGHHLSRRGAAGHLEAGDAMFAALLARPELLPPDEACAAERALHTRLMAAPRAKISDAELAAVEDADARENWGFYRAFRDHLTASPSLEAAYVAMARGSFGGLPPVFVDQLAHLILRNALEGEEDPFVLRAGELFFRPQRVTFHDGAMLLGDADMLAGREIDPHRSPLLHLLGADATTGLDVMDEANAWTYWSRSDAFDMVMSLGTQPRARAGFARAMERWIGHLTGIEARIEPLAGIEDADWRWFIGLDAEATRIGNILWKGGALSLDDASRVLALFKMTAERTAPLRADLRGAPIYLILAMGAGKTVRMKPQNLIAGLPAGGKGPRG